MTYVISIRPTETVSVTDVSVVTHVVTQTSLVTTTISAGAAPFKRAEAKTPLSQQVTESYPASRISSACACLTIPVAIVTVTPTAEGVTTTITTQVASTAPDVTTVVTLSSTTTLPAVTETVTVGATSEIESTTTVVSVVTITASATSTSPPAASTSGFYLRTYRSGDNFFSGNFLLSQDISATNKTQYWRISGSNTTVPHLNLTPEGYLKITQARAPGTAPYGNENQEWVAFTHTPARAELIQFDKLSNIQACTNCQPLVFEKVLDETATWIRLTSTTQAIQVCSQRAPTNTFAVWLGSGPGAIDSSCFTQQLFVSDIGVLGPIFGTPTHY